MRYALIVFGLCFSLSFAQETVLAALDSIEENTLGFSLNGSAKAGALGSILDSKGLSGDADASEYSAFTDFILGISIRPSKETKATFDLRFHKDWQSAYREGNNSPIIRWWSYDGNILNKKLKFNLGTMRVAYTPLTIYLPEPDLIMEPEIFSSLKKDAMEERYLDGTNRRLLQGLNLEFGTSAGIFDRIFLQGTIARLRKVPDGIDRTSFDFDPNKDRFTAGARVGIETFGLYFGVNDVYSFNRYSSSVRNINYDTLINYEKNNVLSFELAYNSKKLLSGPVNFGVGAEYAFSNWSNRLHKRVNVDQKTSLVLTTIDLVPAIIAPVNGSNPYLYYRTSEPTGSDRWKYELIEGLPSLDNKNALLASAFVSFDQKPFEAKLSGNFINVNKDFEAELAASPAYLPNLPILNSDAALAEYGLEQFRTGSLEHMYYSIYYTLPLNAMTIVQGQQGRPASVITTGTNDRSLFQSGYLANNYKLAHYYRNAYTQQTYTRLERGIESNRLDPAVNLALPYGYATPDRTGGDADLNFVWNKAVSVRGVFGSYSSEHADYTRFGGGLEVNVARLAGLGKDLVISGSYEQSKEESGVYNPQADRIMAGAKIGIWRGLSLIGGFQQLSKEFKNPYTLVDDYLAINKTSEILAIGGPQIKISERANFNLQGGLLTNSISFTLDGEKNDIDLEKLIVSGLVTVKF
ncbi:MAG: hypothetical protein FWC15_05110 [Fibromonadales bacterium]|nr:hypothetical protein [Fibromonadales bacterium]